MKSLPIVLSGVALALSAFVSGPANASFAPPLCDGGAVNSEAPAPIDAGRQGRPSSFFDLSDLGFTLEANGSWSCYTPSLFGQGWRVTSLVASYAPSSSLVVGGSFFERGALGPNQEQKTVEFFTLLSGDYGTLTAAERRSVELYLKDVMARIQDGRMQPTGVWHDVYQKLGIRIQYTTYGDGTALFLNVPYRARR